MDQPNTFIIALEYQKELSDRGQAWQRSHSRIHSTLLESLDAHGWSHIPWAAQDGWLLTESHWHGKGMMIKQGSKLWDRPGAQGCLWSHMALWEHCVELDEPIIVLEHDAVCLAEWNPLYEITHDVQKIAYKFTQTRPNKITGEWSPGSVGYSLTPRGAAKMLSWLGTVGAIESDKVIGSRVVDWTHSQRLFDINTASYTRSSTSAK